MFGGTSRSYRIYIPVSYNSSEPVPLVLALHGLGDNANNFQGIGFNQIADTANFIAVYPNALPDPVLGAAGWNAGVNPINTIDDVSFLSALIDTIESEYSIDTNRIYSCGFSLGGFMTYRLACQLGGRFAAIASVAGTLPATLAPTCDPGHVMPVMHFHGTSDQTIPYNYGVFFVVVTNLGADSTVAFWRNYNTCTAAPQHDSVPDTKSDGYTFEKFSNANCMDSSEVILYKVNGMPHTWPMANNDVNATKEMWSFFSRHRKTAPPVNTAITEIRGDFGFYPNPASNNITVKSQFARSFKVVLTDLSGKQLLNEEKEEPSFDFSLTSLPEGIYLMSLTSENSIVTKKLVVCR